MTRVVVVAKDPGRAKERLIGVLSPERRRALALATFDHLLAVLRGLGADIVVVTDSDDVRARSGSARVLRDPARGQSAAAEMAVRDALADGTPRLLILPADLGAPDESELGFLLDTPLEPPAAVLVAATGDGGTNAILASPPDAVPFRFGEDSLAKHRAAASERGTRVETHRLPRLGLDLDTPADVARLLASGADSPAARMLRDWGFR